MKLGFTNHTNLYLVMNKKGLVRFPQLQMQLLTITFSLFAGKTREIQKAFQRIRRRLTCCQACSVPMLQLLLLLIVLNVSACIPRCRHKQGNCGQYQTLLAIVPESHFLVIMSLKFKPFLHQKGSLGKNLIYGAQVGKKKRFIHQYVICPTVQISEGSLTLKS